MQRRSFLHYASLFGLSVTGAQLLNACSSDASKTADSSASPASSPIKELNFGIISTESQANQKPIWEPFIKAFSDGIGMPVKAFYATQYAGVIEAMRFGQVQLAWYGGKSYIEAARIANAEAFAQTVSNTGERGYYAYLITNKNNPIAAPAKAAGGDKYVIQHASDLTFAFNDPNSTSGFLVPSYYVFAKNNVNPKTAFKRLVFAGSHEATALAVANNQIDVATNNSESLSRLEKTNPQAREKIEIIWQSIEIPSDPIAYRNDLPDDLKQKIRSFFYNYKDKTVLDPLEWSGFVAADDKLWNPIRELNIGKQIMETQDNTSMSQQDKQKKLNDLNQQLADLKKSS